MKKFSLLILTLLLTLTLFACNSVKINARVVLTGLSGEFPEGIGPNQINFEMELIDPDEEVETQTINIVLKGDATNKYEKSTTTNKDSLEKDSKFTFDKLDEETVYTLTITTTYNNKTVSLIKEPLSIKTTANMNRDIETVEDFLEIKDNLYANYFLKNDLDFEGYDQDTLNGKLIGNFRGNFDGGGFTIKNYTIESANSSFGLFGQLSSEATVKNLVLDALSITKKDKHKDNKPGGVSSYVGLLFGQNSSSKVEVSDITIKNSTLNLDINSTSSYLKFGLLGGSASGKFENITVEDSNEMNILLRRHTTVYIGGLVGDPNKSAEFNNIINGGNINLSIDQHTLTEPEKDENGDVIEGSEKSLVSNGGLVGQNVRVLVGGFLGRNGNTKVRNVITSTNINVEKVHYSVQTNGDDDDFDSKDTNRYIQLYIGGFYGIYNDIYSNNMVYSGNINVEASFEFSNFLTKVDKDEEDQEIPETEEIVKIRHKYYYNLYVGGFAGYTSKNGDSIKKMVRDGGSIKVKDFNVDFNEPLKYTKTGDETETPFEQALSVFAYGHLFGLLSSNDKSFEYGETNNFGITKPIEDYLGDNLYNEKAIVEGESFRVITDLKKYFEDNEWMQENLK